MTRAIARHIQRVSRTHPRLVLRFAASSLGRTVLAMASILLIREYLALASALGAGAALAVVALLFIACNVGASALNYDNNVIQQRLVKVVELGMMERLIRHLLGLSVPFFDSRSHGDIIQAVRQDVTNLRIATLSLGKIVLEAPMAAGLAVTAFWLSPWLAFWSLLALPLAVVPLVKIAQRILARTFEVRRSGYVLFDVILELMRGIRIIKAYHGEDREARAAIEKGHRYFDQLIDLTRVESLSTVVLESLGALSIVVVIIIGGLEVVQKTLDWPSLIAFVMAVRALFGPLNNLNTNYMLIQRQGAGVVRIDELLAERPQIADAPNAVPLAAAPRSIVLDGVSFSYGEKTILEGLSLEVKAGEKIGITGPSGAGKTTLLNLVARFYDPTRGAVRYDGRDLRAYQVASVYRQIAIVTQEPLLFAATIRENIRCGRPDASDAEVESAARSAEIHDEIAALAEGYETVVGVGGRRLSGGQAQRINIARALLKDAAILLLDEPTSSLDSIADIRVRSALARLMRNPTTFLVSHRLSTLADADRILVLDHGRLAGLGKHDELLDTCPLYRSIWEASQLGESD
ncbi:MAG TPA: ABC transporter ATP-binding protein [Myxococcota bacterium]|nr:ABC transporter ATP-binding protein [Myxococcota bacterium]